MTRPAPDDRFGHLLEFFAGARILDLSPPIHAGMTMWPAHPAVEVRYDRSHDRDGYFSRTLVLPEHTGAHIDAPAHSLPERADHTVDLWPPRHFIVEAYRVDLSGFRLGPGQLADRRMLATAAAELPRARLRDAAVLLDYGWDTRRRADDPQVGAEDMPGLDDTAVDWLSELRPRLIGADTPSVEIALRGGVRTGTGRGHVEWSRRGIAILEGLSRLSEVPARFLLIALPLPLRGGSGSPVRAIAVW